VPPIPPFGFAIRALQPSISWLCWDLFHSFIGWVGLGPKQLLCYNTARVPTILMAEFSLRDAVVFGTPISPPSSKLYFDSLKSDTSQRTIWGQFPATYRRSCS
jgi:hypothetical protein